MTGEGSAIEPIDPVERQIQGVTALAGEVLGDDVVAVYLYGSAVVGGLQHDSDVDLLVLTGRSLTADEKRRVADGLLAISSDPPWGTGPRPGERPLEVTIVARPEIVPWRYPPAMELQYGEWLRATFAAGEALAAEATPNPDLVVLLEHVRRDGRALVGPPARAAIPPIPTADVARAMLAGVDELLAGLDGDTSNGLMTLARMWFTLATGELAPKDLAAEWAMTRLASDDRQTLDRARAAYLGDGEVSWRGQEGRARQCATRLAGQVVRAAQDAGVNL